MPKEKLPSRVRRENNIKTRCKACEIVKEPVGYLPDDRRNRDNRKPLRMELFPFQGKKKNAEDGT